MVRECKCIDYPVVGNQPLESKLRGKVLITHHTHSFAFLFLFSFLTLNQADPKCPNHLALANYSSIACVEDLMNFAFAWRQEGFKNKFHCWLLWRHHQRRWFSHKLLKWSWTLYQNVWAFLDIFEVRVGEKTWTWRGNPNPN